MLPARSIRALDVFVINMHFQLTRSQFITLAIATLVSISIGLIAARVVASEPNAYVAGYIWFGLLLTGSILILCLLIVSLILLIVRETKSSLLLMLCSVLLAGSYLIGFAVMQKIGWTNFNEEMTPIIPEVADLVVIFRPDANHEQIQNFWNEILSTGQVGGIARIPSIEGHAAIAISFFPSASEAQREEVKAKVKSSPIVYRVMENAHWLRIENNE